MAGRLGPGETLTVCCSTDGYAAALFELLKDRGITNLAVVGPSDKAALKGSHAALEQAVAPQLAKLIKAEAPSPEFTEFMNRAARRLAKRGKGKPWTKKP